MTQIVCLFVDLDVTFQRGTAKEMITFWECKHHAIVTTQPQFFEDI